jgi:hypothetical protein
LSGGAEVRLRLIDRGIVLDIDAKVVPQSGVQMSQDAELLAKIGRKSMKKYHDDSRACRPDEE